MTTTLKKALDSIKKYSSPKSSSSGKVSEELLGKYQNIIPPKESSSDFIRRLRVTRRSKVSK